VDHIIPTYSIFHQDEFLEKLTEFFEKAKQFFKSSNDEPDEYDSSTISEEKEIVTIDILMNSFADYFKGKLFFNLSLLFRILYFFFKKKKKKKIFH